MNNNRTSYMFCGTDADIWPKSQGLNFIPKNPSTHFTGLYLSVFMLNFNIFNILWYMVVLYCEKWPYPNDNIGKFRQLPTTKQR